MNKEIKYPKDELKTVTKGLSLHPSPCRHRTPQILKLAHTHLDKIE